MIPEAFFPRVQTLWPLCQQAAAPYRLDPKLLLAMAWVESAFAPEAVSSVGARGLVQIMPATAQDIARALKVESFDLFDPATSLRFAAYYIHQQIDRFGLPRVALAAYNAGPGTVARARDQVPSDTGVQKYVRDVMAVWTGLQGSLPGILAWKPEGAVAGGKPTQPDLGWRLIIPPDRWQSPVQLPDPDHTLQLLEEVATRLSLAFHRDDERHKVYLGLPRSTGGGKTLDKQPLLVPVPGATAANNGMYLGDSGLDLIVPMGSPVVAAAAGTILYSERGHTPWTHPPDTPNSLLISLDQPIDYKGQRYPFTWYTHLSRLRFQVPDGSEQGPHVDRGELLGWSGIGNRVAHLHFGVVADRPQTVFIPPMQLAAWFGWLGGGVR